jgi:hypothetical protein
VGVIAGLVFVIAVLIFLKLKSVTKSAHVKARAIHSTLKRILLTHMQVVAMVATLNVPWPRDFLNMVAVFSATSSVSQHMSALSCEMTKHSNPIGKEATLLYSQTLLLVCIPPVTVLFMFVYWVVLAPYLKCLACFRPLRASPIFNCAVNSKTHKQETQKTTSPEESIHDEMARAVLEAEEAQRKSSQKSNGPDEKRTKKNTSAFKRYTISTGMDDNLLMSTRDAWSFSLSLCFYIIYPTLVRFPFALFQCRNIGDEYYLERDLQENCNGSRHLHYMIALAIPALLLVSQVSYGKIVFSSRRNSYMICSPLSLFVAVWNWFAVGFLFAVV